MRRRFGEPEIEHLHDAGGTDHDVPRLDVAVHDAAVVRLDEGEGDLPGDADGVREVEPPAPHPLRQRLALDVLHDDVRPVRILADVVDRADVRVIDGRRQARLAKHAPLRLIVSSGDPGEHFDRHVAVQPRVGREVDLSHPTRPKRREDTVGSEATEHVMPQPRSGRSCQTAFFRARSEMSRQGARQSNVRTALAVAMCMVATAVFLSSAAQQPPPAGTGRQGGVSGGRQGGPAPGGAPTGGTLTPKKADDRGWGWQVKAMMNPATPRPLYNRAKEALLSDRQITSYTISSFDPELYREVAKHFDR